MASTEMSASANGSRKIAAESSHVLPPPPGLLGVDFYLRLLLFAYAVSALAVTCLYSIITMMAVFFAISPTTRRLFLLSLFDALMAGVMASATGAAGFVAYIGLRGNSQVNWSKVYNVYGKFCRHIGSSITMSVVTSILLILLVVPSVYSLDRRCH